MEVPRGSMKVLPAWVLLMAGVSTPGAGRLVAAGEVQATATVIASVDVRVTQRVLERDGSQAWPMSTQTSFTLQKLRTASGDTKISLAYRPTPQAARTPAVPNPLDDARVEYDPALGSTTVFDAGGRRANPRLSPERTPTPALGSFDEWLQALVLRASDVPARREALERTHGRPVGTVGRLTRYVRTQGDTTEEVLADAAWGVPMEVNVLRQDVLEGHVTIEYEATPNGNLQRRRLQSEQLIDARTGRRAVLSVDFSNIVVQSR